MDCAVEALRKLRSLKMCRDRHKRLYRRRRHIIRAAVRAFATSERGKRFYREYSSKRLKKPHYHFLNWIRGSINRDILRQSAKKGGRTEVLIGCSFDELQKHLESQFTNEFSWANRSSWHVDHYVPVSAFDLTNPEEQRWAFNYRNLRPMNGKLNQQKSDTLPSPLPSWLPTHIAERIVKRSPPTHPESGPS